MSYEPHDIQATRDPILWETPYGGTLGKSEWEETAATLVAASQRAGEWVGIPETRFTPRLRNHLSGMVSAGYLTRTADNKVMLTGNALERIVMVYSATEETA